MLRTVKQFVRRGLRGVQPYSYRFGSALLRNSVTRAAFNGVRERFAGVTLYAPRNVTLEDLFIALFERSEIQKAFVWKCRFGTRTFLLPVSSELRESWWMASFWTWPPNRPIRTFYEFYLSRRSPGVVFDIGANLGGHTYPFAAYGNQCVCFEPQATCIEYIERVCKLNDFRQVTVVPCVVSDIDDRIVEFFVSEATAYSSLSKAHVEAFEPSTMISVRSIALDSYCLERQIRPTFVKIDVEGAEWSVLQGGRYVFEHFRPDAFIEVDVHSAQRKDIWDFFARLGYAAYLVLENVREPFRPLNTLDEYLQAGVKERALNVNIIFLSNGDPRLTSEFATFVYGMTAADDASR